MRLPSNPAAYALLGAGALGTAAGVSYGWNHTDPNDADRMTETASSGLMGGVLGLGALAGTAAAVKAGPSLFKMGIPATGTSAKAGKYLIGNAARTGARYKRFISPLPGKGVWAPALVAAGIYGAGKAMQDPIYDDQAEAAPDGMGGYDYAAPGTSGAGRRARMMNATGDIAFGLHNKRHGS